MFTRKYCHQHRQTPTEDGKGQGEVGVEEYAAAIGDGNGTCNDSRHRTQERGEMSAGELLLSSEIVGKG